MAIISVKDEYVEVLNTLGDLQEGIDSFFKHYAIEKIVEKITELGQKDCQYQTKYGMDYPTFFQKVSEEELFVKQIEESVEKMWEIDLADWEFCYKGAKDWLEKLQIILLI